MKMPFTKKIAFASLCTSSHLPFARVLFDSIHKLYPNAPLFLLLVDKVAGDCSCGEITKVIPVEELKLAELSEMVERYPNTALCASLKPFIIQEVFNRGSDTVEGCVFFDSDIYLFSEMRELEELVDQGVDIVLTPHISDPLFDSGRTKDIDLLKYGTFNAGFVYFANSAASKELLAWWGDRTKKYCSEDTSTGLYGDQKWLNLFPGFVENLKVLRHQGYNAAYWNILRRKVFHLNGRWVINGDIPLCFFHFSNLIISSPQLLTLVSHDYPEEMSNDIPLLLREYTARVLAQGYEKYKMRPCLLREKPFAGHDPRQYRVDAILKSAVGRVEH